MKLEVTSNGNIETFDLDALATQFGGVVNIGRKSDEVWNTIAIDSEGVDNFQCSLIGSAGGSWRLSNGQHRTECPKGLLSSKMVPCNGCLGRCVNLRAGRPKYYQRVPETPTLINNADVSQWGTELNPGDVISFADVTIKVN